MNSNLTVGSQFAIDAQNNTINDTWCEEQTTGPRLTFQAHMAPVDITFNDSGIEAWVTFRGSWDRTDPVGYKLSVCCFFSALRTFSQSRSIFIGHFSLKGATLIPQRSSQVIPFTNGEPVAASDNDTATIDILANADNSVCPDHCFRPVGIAFDDQGRLFMSSDASGEIYVVVRDETANGSSAGSGGGVSEGVRGRGMKGVGWVALGMLVGLVVV